MRDELTSDTLERLAPREAGLISPPPGRSPQTHPPLLGETGDWTEETIHDHDDFMRLRREWNDLASPFATPLLTFEWFEACAAAVCPPERLSIVVVRSTGRIMALAPLVTVRKMGVDHLEILGSSLLGEPGGLIYRDRESLRRILRAIVAKRLPTALGRLPVETGIDRFLHQEVRSSFSLSLRGISYSPWIPIAGSRRDFEEGLSSRRRSDLKRARRRADEFGSVEFEITTPPPESLGRSLEELFEVEAAGWKERRGTSIRSLGRLRQFLKSYSLSAGRAGTLRLCFLRIGGRAAAAQCAVEYAGALWVLKIGYNEAYARCSPGILLMHEVIGYAFDRGLRRFEFLGNDEPWIRMWAHDARSYVSWRWYPPSLRGLLSLCRDGVGFLAEKLVSFKRNAAPHGKHLL
jgi:CelD/BcsL family acetyltransferase involved in cellulose biosynthesis